MKRNSALALGASLLAFALPTAAQASTLGGITGSLPSVRAEAKVVGNGPIDAKAHVKGKISGRLHDPVRAQAKAEAKSGGSEARHQTSARNGARLETGGRAYAAPIRAEVRLKAKVRTDGSRAVAPKAGEVAHAAKRLGGLEPHAAKHLVRGGLHESSRYLHRARGKASHAKRKAPAVAAPRRGLGESLARVGREVGNPLQAGLAGGLLLGLGCAAGTLARLGVRRGLR